MPTINKLPEQFIDARFAPSTLKSSDKGTTTVELVWSTGAQVRRYDWWEDREFVEELDMSPDAVNLARLNKGAPVLRDHSQSINSVIGVVERAWLDNGEGKAEIRFSDRADVKDIIADVQSGILRNISVGYSTEETTKIERDGELTIYRATRWTPMELSLVAIPADADSQIRSAEKFYNVTIRGVDMPKADSVETKTEEVKTESVRSEVNETEIAQRAIQAERKRVAAIRDFAKLAKADESVIEQMIESGVSVETAKERMLDAWSKRVDSETSRGDVSITVTEDETDKRNAAISAAILGRAGMLKADERKQLQGNEFVGFRMLDIARICAERAGVKTSGLSAMEIVGRAFTQSTSDFDVILENTMHKAMLGAYAVASNTWRRFCRTGSVSDFRAWKRLRTGSIGNLDSLNELGEFTNKTIPDGEAESVQASTRGNLINVSRQAIINDDMGYFLGLSAELSRAAARTIESQVYTTLVANAALSDSVALFHADHGNLAGTGAAPTVATVDAGRQAMAIQTDISGNDYLDIRPTIALAPVSLGSTLREINSAEYNVDKSPGSTSGKNIYTPNTVRGLFTDIIDSPRLSGTAWYMFADPAEAPVMEVVFLDGNDQPFLDRQDGFSVDGTSWKVRLDFGVGVVDYRGAYKNAGA